MIKVFCSFDACFDERATQDDIFQHIKPYVEQVLLGKNTTIFAYGASGTGKSYTIEGSTTSPGLIPRAVHHLLSKTGESGVKEKFRITFSHMEIYNEKVYDLTCSSRKELFIRQNADQSIVVADLKRTPISSFTEFETLYRKTRENRSTALTSLNAASSRSHSILRIEFCWYDEKSRERSSKLNLIDLAGSEDNRKTGNNKERMVESGNINKSLFMLSQVVDALNNGQTNIPYRNSKLTRLLQDSLGGKALTLMITNISPASSSYLDTVNTLNMARKTKKIEVDEPVVVESKKRSLDFSKDLQKEEKRPKVQNEVKTANPTLEELLINATPNTKIGLVRTIERMAQNDNRSSGPVQLKIEKTLDKKISEKSKSVTETLKENNSPKNEDNVEEKAELTEEAKAKIDEEVLEILNSGNVKRITQLKGIGVSRAQHIVDHFNNNGSFTKVRDLELVDGISAKIVQKILDSFYAKAS